MPGIRGEYSQRDVDECLDGLEAEAPIERLKSKRQVVFDELDRIEALIATGRRIADITARFGMPAATLKTYLYQARQQRRLKLASAEASHVEIAPEAHAVRSSAPTSAPKAQPPLREPEKQKPPSDREIPRTTEAGFVREPKLNEI